MNTPNDIPNGEGMDAEDTDLDLPDLPGGWEWGSVNHLADFTGKVNVFFGRNIYDAGGWIGEIDNFSHDGEVVWEIHVRAVEAAPGTQHGSLPAEKPETTEQFGTLDEAIEAVPGHISTYYGE